MDEQSKQIVKDIQDKREKLNDNLVELEHRVREVADWRTYFHRNPWPLVGAAAATGLLLASILIPQRRGNS